MDNQLELDNHSGFAPIFALNFGGSLVYAWG